MKYGQCRLYVRPQNRGAHTRWRLSGSLVTTLPTVQLRSLFRTLSFWSGWPVELVLPADSVAAGWFAWWSDAVAQIPADHLHVRFVLPSLAARPTNHEH
jgi:hypothetical protein